MSLRKNMSLSGFKIVLLMECLLYVISLTKFIYIMYDLFFVKKDWYIKYLAAEIKMSPKMFSETKIAIQLK